MIKFFKTRSKSQWVSLLIATVIGTFLFFLMRYTWQENNPASIIAMLIGLVAAIIVGIIYIEKQEKKRGR